MSNPSFTRSAYDECALKKKSQESASPYLKKKTVMLKEEDSSLLKRFQTLRTIKDNSKSLMSK